VKKQPDPRPVRDSLLVTAVFCLVALFGLLHHEMWRDEHQAWLVARDAHSFAQLLDNVRYEGNPALWHSLLFLLTRFTANPLAMQLLHLAIACGFVFVFNRYAPFPRWQKILFSFGYFPLYEYAVISRSYGLGLLLLFVVCALYKHRRDHYMILGVVLALLANVTVYGAILSLSFAGILAIDYRASGNHDRRTLVRLVAGLAVFAAGFLLSVYQIWPEPDNSFPSPMAKELFDTPRWMYVLSRLFTTYFYVPEFIKGFWNTSLFTGHAFTPENLASAATRQQHPGFVWVGFLLPVLTLAAGLLLFLRKPRALLFYAGATLALLAIFYYTYLVHYRYCGHLLAVLLAAYWIGAGEPDQEPASSWMKPLSALGKKMYRPFLATVLVVQVAGAAVAYAMDAVYPFSTSKMAVDFVEKNKLDTLPMVGITDFTVSAFSTYLNRPIYFPQMHDYGSFTVWNSRRINNMSFSQMVGSVDSFMDRRYRKILYIKDSAPQLTQDGIHYIDMQRGMITADLQMDLLQSYPPGIVSDEKFYIYTVQRVDSTKVDPNMYPRIF
jgi:hypothetical protein